MAYAQFSLTELQGRLAARRDSSAYWTAEEERLAINETLKLWNLVTGQWRQVVDIAVDGGDPYVALPLTFTWPRRMLFNTIPLTYARLQDLAAVAPGWRGNSVGGTGLPTAPVLWAPVSMGLLVLWPYTSGTLTVDGLAQTPLLVNAGDFVDLNETYLDALLGFVRHTLTFKEGAARLQTTGPAIRELVVAAGQQNPEFALTGLYQRLTEEPPDPRVFRRTGPPRLRGRERT